MVRAPRFFRALLERFLPRDEQSVVADLQEMLEKRAERHGAFRARMWYRVQAISFIARFAWERPSFSLLDWKLGFRMLLKYPGLSLVGGLAMAASIGFGAGFYHMLLQTVYPDLGLDEGERIVVLDRFDPKERRPHPIPVPDLLEWRAKLTELVEVSAYRSIERSLVDESGISRPVTVAEITPSAFPLTRVAPLRGRALTDADVDAAAADVIVVGYRLWQERLGGDEGIIGRDLQLGRATYRVVGVMPEGYAFPLNHSAWIPLRLDPTSDIRTTLTFARLAPAATIESASAELAAVGAQTLVPMETPGPLIPRVIRFGAPDPSGDDVAGAIFGNFLIILLLVAASANVATLVFARTAMRESEIVVRSALGASRGRIMGQLFVESLVLSSVSAAVGLVGASAVIRYVFHNPSMVEESGLPFWWKPELEPGAIFYAGVLAVLGAAMVAILPALKATGARVQEGLKNAAAAGTSLSFGGVWSVIIVLQVAITVIALPFGVEYAQGVWHRYQVRAAFPSDGYLTFRMDVDPEGGTVAAGDGAPRATGAAGSAAGVAGRVRTSDEQHRALIGSVYGELERRLAAEPGVQSVTFADGLPGMLQDWGYIEVDRTKGDASSGDSTMSNPYLWAVDTSVGVGLFDAFGVPVVEGRAFNNGDVGAANQPILINESLARAIGGGAGTRVRRTSQGMPGPWLEVVGVVRDIGADPDDLGNEERFIYRPAAVGELTPLVVAVKTRGNPEALIPRLREIAARVDPGIRITEVRPLADVLRGRDWPDVLASLSSVGGIFICVLLSAAGLFALMAVAVARRTREVGIRLALGASRLGILAALFRRSAEQLTAGIAIGAAAVYVILGVFDESHGFPTIPMLSVAGVMLLVGLLACAVPARRALRIKPVEALREG